MASIFHQPHTFNFHFFNKSSRTCCPMGVAMSLNSTQELKYISLRVQVSPARFSDFFRFFAGTKRRPSPFSSLLRSHTFLWAAASPFWLMGFSIFIGDSLISIPPMHHFEFIASFVVISSRSSSKSRLHSTYLVEPPHFLLLTPPPDFLLTSHNWMHQVTCLRTLCGGVSLARRQLDRSGALWDLWDAPVVPLFNWRLPSVTPQLDHSPDGARCQACASTRDCCNLHHTQPQHLMWILPTKDSQHMSTLQLRWTLKQALQMPSVFGANHPRQTWKQNLDASLGTETLRCTGLEVSKSTAWSQGLPEAKLLALGRLRNSLTCVLPVTVEQKKSRHSTGHTNLSLHPF
jgi:hypothetical protein